MGLDLWFREDVARMLAATEEAVTSSLGAVTAACPQEAAAYQKGFADALRSVGVAFGVVVPPSRRQTGFLEALSIPDAGVVPVGLPEGQVERPHGGCRS